MNIGNLPAYLPLFISPSPRLSLSLPPLSPSLSLSLSPSLFLSSPLTCAFSASFGLLAIPSSQLEIGGVGFQVFFAGLGLVVRTPGQEAAFVARDSEAGYVMRLRVWHACSCDGAKVLLRNCDGSSLSSACCARKTSKTTHDWPRPGA